MYARLGNIIFQNLKGLNELSKTTTVTYAEHKPLAGKPLLQATGPNLDEVTISMRLHASFCNPAEELSTLREYMDTFEVLPLLLGNGKKEGEFVIMSINNVVEDADPAGNVFSYMVSCTLKEYVTPNRLQAEQDDNREAALAVGDVRPVAKLKANALTPPVDIAKSISAININAKLINDTVEQKGGVTSVNNRNTIARSAESIKNFCTDLREKYQDLQQGIEDNETINAIRDTAGLVHAAADQVSSTITLPSQFIASNRVLAQTVLNLKTVAHPIVLKSITGQ